jgi:short-subunit dehydrogenase
MAARPGPVAAAGLAALSANQAIVIPGAINKVGAQGSRFLPRSLIRRIAGALK